MNLFWRRSGMLALLVAIAAAGFTARESQATTTYFVRLDTSALTSQAARIALDLSGQFNIVQILDFEHDGKMGLPETQGGIITGDLMMSLNPSYYTSMFHQGPDGTQFYFTSLVVNFDSLGAAITFAVDLTELYIPFSLLPDNVSMSILGAAYYLPLFNTADPLGANALFSIDINGVAGGDLTVFAPMQFVAPDSLILQVPVTSVPPEVIMPTRLRFRSVYPNPTADEVHFEFEAPAAAGHARLSIYDLSGRMVERVYDGYPPAGVVPLNWSGRDASQRRVPAGVYFAQLEMGGQTAIRKVVLNR